MSVTVLIKRSFSPIGIAPMSFSRINFVLGFERNQLQGGIIRGTFRRFWNNNHSTRSEARDLPSHTSKQQSSQSTPTAPFGGSEFVAYLLLAVASPP